MIGMDKDYGQQIEIICFAIGLVAIMCGFYLIHYSSRRFEARRRLCEPVDSLERLHGYRVVAKQTLQQEDGELKITTYKIDIYDILPFYFSLGTIKKLEVTEDVYKKIKIEPEDSNDSDDQKKESDDPNDSS